MVPTYGDTYMTENKGNIVPDKPTNQTVIFPWDEWVRIKGFVEKERRKHDGAWAVRHPYTPSIAPALYTQTRRIDSGRFTHFRGLSIYPARWRCRAENA